MEAFFMFIVAAFLLESLIETAKMVYEEGNFYPDRVLSIVAGISFAVLANLNLFDLLGIDLPFWAGQICTGILLSRGSNFIHDILKTTQDIAGGVE